MGTLEAYNITIPSEVTSDLYGWKLHQDNVLYWYMKENVTIDETAIKKSIQDGLDLAEYKPYKTIVDLTAKDSKIEQDAINCMSENEDMLRLKTKEAVVVDSYLKSMLMGIYMRIQKPKIPTKVFSSLESAITWIYED